MMPGDEECERLKRLDGTVLQRKCVRFVADHAGEIAKAEPEIPQGLANRAADVWEGEWRTGWRMAMGVDRAGICDEAL